ncbi:FAD-binding oxidoreductase [Nocardioides sp. LMS-CY]|nr:FAD-binding oxidoreductase [Nocardioides sp. LMS-CY]
MSLRGWGAHERAVERLRSSYEALPPGSPVRLAKKTSNLFRPRAATTSPGLDVSGLDGVIAVDPAARTADVQGMCTYEDLVDATLPHGLIPYVVPQLRTITLGGAVTGLGIESTSFRNGLPHESVVEMDVFTGAGEVVTCRPGPDGEHSDLFDTFPNSYGSLGYATRLKIRLEQVPGYVALRHVRFDDADLLAKTIREVAETAAYDGTRVDGLDGVAFGPGEYYLTLATWQEQPGPTSDYTGMDVYYRSLQQRETDLLTIYDYLWRWDTDWFWCSGAFGVQNPKVRRLWPKRWRRSDVYHKLIALDRRFDVADRLDRRAGRPLRERVIQDIEVPVERLPEFLDWFDAEVGMRPVWLCPCKAERDWPTYPLEPDRLYVNVGFWGTVHVGPEAVDAPRNRAIETKVHELDGHKSLYSEAFYDRETFDQLYDGAHLAAVKGRYDPQDRLTTLYDKAVKRR